MGFQKKRSIKSYPIYIYNFFLLETGEFVFKES